MNPRKIYQTIALVLVVLVGIIMQRPYFKEFPEHIHAWAQSDRYALALGFIDNHFNFFKPQTYVLNHQFPNDWGAPSGSRVTAVDFPVHDYIAALLMKLFCTRAPWVFRIYLLLYSFVGLLFLFKLMFLITKNNNRSVLVTLFAATSPVFIYYQAGFLPTIPSLANAMIGVYFYLDFYEAKRRRSFMLSVLFLTLAALSRTTFAIPLIALACAEFLNLIKQPKEEVWKFRPIVAGVVLLLGYAIFNVYLRDKYGSIFLSSPIPARNWGEAKEVLSDTVHRWGFHYFTVSQYIIAAMVFVLSLLFVFLKRQKRETVQTPASLFIGIYWLGSLMFAVLMLRQFANHDYYFLDIFFLPFLLLVGVALSAVPEIKSGNKVLRYAPWWVLLVVPMVLQAHRVQEKRHVVESWDKNHSSVENYTGVDCFLDSLVISRQSKILVPDAISPNLPFILIGRTGYTVLKHNYEHFVEAFAWPFDYVVIQNENLFPEVYSVYPEVADKLDLVAANQNISVFKRKVGVNGSLAELLGVNDRQPLLSDSVSFGGAVSGNWHNLKTREDELNNGTILGYVASGDEFGITFKTSNLHQVVGKNRYLFVDGLFMGKVTNDCFLVASVQKGDKSFYYKTFNLKDNKINEGNWQKQSFVFHFSEIPPEATELAFYIWNSGHNELYYSGLRAKIY